MVRSPSIARCAALGLPPGFRDPTDKREKPVLCMETLAGTETTGIFVDIGSGRAILLCEQTGHRAPYALALLPGGLPTFLGS